MTKRKVDEQLRLKHVVTLRIGDGLHQQLSKILKESDCGNLGEVVRRILAGKKIKYFYKDARLDGPMEEMALIRKELKAIGVNINQQTRYFNACKSSAEKKFYAEQTMRYYHSADQKVERLLVIISKLAEAWLPRS